MLDSSACSPRWIRPFAPSRCPPSARCCCPTRWVYPQPAAHAGVGVSRHAGRGAAGGPDPAGERRRQPHWLRAGGPGGEACCANWKRTTSSASRWSTRLTCCARRSAKSLRDDARHGPRLGRERHRPRPRCWKAIDEALQQDPISRVRLRIPQSEGRAAGAGGGAGAHLRAPVPRRSGRDGGQRAGISAAHDAAVRGGVDPRPYGGRAVSLCVIRILSGLSH